MARHKRLQHEDLGIDLASKDESQLFRWFLACLLFGKPIQQQIAARAYVVITEAGITSLSQLATSSWNTLVRLLDTAKYTRYDFSTASKLIDIASNIRRDYGSVGELVGSAKGGYDLTNRLMQYKGIGKVTAAIFVEGIAPIWFTNGSQDAYAAAVRAVEVLRSHSFEAYIIGGAVRDMLLGLTPKDFDVVTSATPSEVMALQEFALAKYKDPAQAFGVTRVRIAGVAQGVVIEIAAFRKDIDAHQGRKATTIEFTDLRGDVLRRDLTINALALDPLTGQILDYAGGIDDVECKLIRFIGDPAMRIQEDPLRILRAIRFRNHLNFSYDSRTALGIRHSVAQGQVSHIAIDRIRDELTRMLTHPSRRSAIVDLDDFGILERILPEVTAGKGVMQQPEFHAEGDVWRHQLLVLDCLPAHPSRRLVWAALLHDIGKPATRMMPLDGSDRVHFDRHYAVGAELAKTVLRRLRFSNNDIRDITWMIYNHMSIDDLPAMRPSNRQRMMSHPAFSDLLELHRADAAASWRPGITRAVKPKFKEIERLWRDYMLQSPELRQPSLKRDLGIDGHWLMKHFGKEYDLRGPIVGKVLRELEDWYQDEGVSDKSMYTDRARQLLQEQIGESR